jgi:hypothetical protein
MGEKRNVYRMLAGKPEGKRPLESPRRRWVDNIKMEIAKIVLSGVDWVRMAQDRDKWRALVNAVMNLRILYNAGELSSRYTTDGLSSSAQFHRVVWVLHAFSIFNFMTVLRADTYWEHAAH